jgi:uncharacterized membrane protein
MSPAADRLRLKTWILTAIVILANVLGNSSLSWGMKQRGAALAFSPRQYLAAVLSPWVCLGIGLLILWLLSRMALLSWADLSYVLPVTALGYVLTALAGRLFLGEQVSPQRWMGTLLIVAGTVLVGSTSIRTTPAAAVPEDR